MILLPIITLDKNLFLNSMFFSIWFKIYMESIKLLFAILFLILMTFFWNFLWVLWVDSSAWSNIINSPETVILIKLAISYILIPFLSIIYLLFTSKAHWLLKAFSFIILISILIIFLLFDNHYQLEKTRCFPDKNKEITISSSFLSKCLEKVDSNRFFGINH